MADGPQTPEQPVSSIEFMRRIGQVGPDKPYPHTPTVYGSKEAETQKLEQSGDISPSIAASRRSTDLMQTAGSKEPEKDKKEPPEATRHMGREGGRLVEVLEGSVDSRQLIDASRAYMTLFENMNLHPDGTIAEWSMDQIKAALESRKSAMSMTIQDLVDMGYVTCNKDESEASFSFPGYSYTTTIELKPMSQTASINEKGEVDPASVRVNLEQTPVHHLGKQEQRDALVEILSRVDGEMTAREDLVKMLRFVWNQTENLEGLVQFYFKGSLTNEAMRLLCDAEGRFKNTPEGKRESFLKGTEGGVEYREGHEFGDAISVSLQCLEIAALSEKPREFENLLKRPGIKSLFKVTDQDIDDLFLPPELRKNRDGSVREIKPILKTWIGEPWTWKKYDKEGKPKEIGDSKEDNIKTKGARPDTQNLRGLFTEKGNILVESDWSDAVEIFKNIDRFLKDEDENTRLHPSENKSTMASKEASEARFIAWGLMRTTGMASDLGGQVYHKEADTHLGRDPGNYIHHEMGGMTSCDRVKIIAPNTFTSIYRYLKQVTQGYGPDGAFGKYPDRFTVPYFKTWTGKGIGIVNGQEINIGKRSFDEMRWGYRAEKDTDLRTGEKIDLPEEKAFRLGELSWDQLSPKAYNAAALGPYIAGREGIGLFQYMMKTDWDIKQLKEKTFWEKFAANIRLSANAQTVFNGKFRGVYNGSPDKVYFADDDKTKEKPLTHDQAVATKVDDTVRDYRKKIILAFWDGIRSLPQYQEWCGADLEKFDTKPSAAPGAYKGLHPVQKIINRIGRIGILTEKETRELESKSYYSNKEETKIA